MLVSLDSWLKRPAIIGTLVVCFGAITSRAVVASPNPNAEPIDSPLSRSTASTTTETKPYVANVQASTSLTLLYSGSRGSKLEPCGCRSLNLGGIDKEAAMVQAIQKAIPAVAIVDAGGFFREFTDENLRLQGYHLLEALKQLGTHAINVGYADLHQGLGNLVKLRDQLGLPLISSNIVNATTKQPIFDPYKIVQLSGRNGEAYKVAILGITVPNYGFGHPTEGPARQAFEAGPLSPVQLAQPAPAGIPEHEAANLRSKWSIAPVSIPGTEAEVLQFGGAADTQKPGGNSPALEFAFAPTTATASIPYEMLDEAQALRPLVEKLRPDVDLIVLASFTGWERTQKIVESVAGIDIAIAGEFLRHYDPERVGPSNTLLVATDHDGKYLGRVDVRISGRGKQPEASAELIPILQSIEPDKAFTSYIEAYSRESAALPIPEGQKIAEKLYAGATSCRTCHAMEYAQWKTHPHSHAMKTLVDKGMQYNVDCLRCHTVAYKQPGGFTDIRVTPGLANVQCEVCHGPAQKHVEEQQMRATAQAASLTLGAAATTTSDKLTSGTHRLKMQWDANFCMQCHDPNNDPNFKFDEDIKRVRHKDPAPARVRPTTASLTM
jgi:hypothetical protein